MRLPDLLKSLRCLLHHTSTMMDGMIRQPWDACFSTIRIFHLITRLPAAHVINSNLHLLKINLSARDYSTVTLPGILLRSLQVHPAFLVMNVIVSGTEELPIRILLYLCR